jgi:hypothetical protein
MVSIKEWTVQIQVFETDEYTSARADLHPDPGAHAQHPLRGQGRARRNPADAEVPEIGDELAVSRALRDLADRLSSTAWRDIHEVEEHGIPVVE